MPDCPACGRPLSRHHRACPYHPVCLRRYDELLTQARAHVAETMAPVARQERLSPDQLVRLTIIDRWIEELR